VRGLDAFIITQFCYIEYKIPIIAPVQPAYVQIETRVTSLKNSYIQIETPIEAGIKRCFIRNLGGIEQPQLAYTNGALKAQDFQACYIHLPTQVVESQSSFIAGTYLNIVNSTMCYVFQTGVEILTHICYINGTRIGEVDNVRNAFILGTNVHNYLRTDPNMCYTNGVVRTTFDLQRCFIINQGLIGDWKLDDGQFDYGTASSNDYSSADNDGANVNFPGYVEGHYREDCND
jgi:hypothetical protein